MSVYRWFYLLTGRLGAPVRDLENKVQICPKCEKTLTKKRAKSIVNISLLCLSVCTWLWFYVVLWMAVISTHAILLTGALQAALSANSVYVLRLTEIMLNTKWTCCSFKRSFIFAERLSELRSIDEMNQVSIFHWPTWPVTDRHCHWQMVPTTVFRSIVCKHTGAWYRHTVRRHQGLCCCFSIN